MSDPLGSTWAVIGGLPCALGPLALRTAQTLAARGARVVLLRRPNAHPPAGPDDGPGGVEFLEADDLDSAFDRIGTELAPVRGVVVETEARGLGTDLHRCPLERWDEMVTSALTGAFEATRAALATFLTEGCEGSIVHLVCASDPHDLATGTLITAMTALVRSTTREYGGRGIRCNLVVAEPAREADAARAAAFFASADASFVNGEIIRATAEEPRP
jgi:NAD(P)-dependent dehydrogenase (short-subunit alcohol dehydrogenase family)